MQVYHGFKVNALGVVREESVVVLAQEIDHLLDRTPHVRQGAVELGRPHLI